MSCPNDIDKYFFFAVQHGLAIASDNLVADGPAVVVHRCDGSRDFEIVLQSSRVHLKIMAFSINDVLPNELLAWTFDYLDESDVLKVRETCRRWKAVVTDTSRRLTGLLGHQADDVHDAIDAFANRITWPLRALAIRPTTCRYRW